MKWLKKLWNWLFGIAESKMIIRAYLFQPRTCQCSIIRGIDDKGKETVLSNYTNSIGDTFITRPCAVHVGKDFDSIIKEEGKRLMDVWAELEKLGMEENDFEKKWSFDINRDLVLKGLKPEEKDVIKVTEKIKYE